MVAGAAAPEPRLGGGAARFAIRLALAAASGILLATSYPPSPAGELAWIAFVPLLLAAFHPFALPFVSLVSATLFFGLPVLCIRPFLRRPLLALAAAPSIFVLFEYAKQNWFLQFPFGVLGYTQWSWTRLIQVANLGGTALVSWAIVLVNTAVYLAVDRLLSGREAPDWWRRLATCLGTAVVVLGGCLLYGTLVTAGMTYDPDARLKIGYAQTFFRTGRTEHDGQAQKLQAVETRRPVLRISNGGLSGYFDELGTYSSSLPLFSAGTMTSRLLLLREKPTSLYVKAGDWLIVVCLAAAAFAAGISVFRRKDRSQ